MSVFFALFALVVAQKCPPLTWPSDFTGLQVTGPKNGGTIEQTALSFKIDKGIYYVQADSADVSTNSIISVYLNTDSYSIVQNHRNGTTNCLSFPGDMAAPDLSSYRCAGEDVVRGIDVWIFSDAQQNQIFVSKLDGSFIRTSSPGQLTDFVHVSRATVPLSRFAAPTYAKCTNGEAGKRRDVKNLVFKL